jgi:hypothetical protein
MPPEGLAQPYKNCGVNVATLLIPSSRLLHHKLFQWYSRLYNIVLLLRMSLVISESVMLTI